MKAHAFIGKILVVILAIALSQNCWADLVAHYTFDGNADDASGNDNDGTVYGATLTTDRFGAANSAYSFDGINDYIRVADAPELDGMDELTVSLWINISTANHEAELLNKYLHYTGTVVDDSYNMGIDPAPGGATVAFQYATADGYVIKISSAVLPLGSWHHIAGVYTGTEGSVYIDGSRVALWRDDPESPGPLNIVASDLLIGCGEQPGSLVKFFNGSVDDLRIYDRALSDSEVYDLSVVPVPAAALLGSIGVTMSGWLCRRRR